MKLHPGHVLDSSPSIVKLLGSGPWLTASCVKHPFMKKFERPSRRQAQSGRDTLLDRIPVIGSENLPTIVRINGIPAFCWSAIWQFANKVSEALHSVSGDIHSVVWKVMRVQQTEASKNRNRRGKSACVVIFPCLYKDTRRRPAAYLFVRR